MYRRLQVFDHAQDHLPDDEEFLLAALFHAIGQGLDPEDPEDHVGSGLEALAGLITPQTAGLIANHWVAHQIADRTIRHAGAEAVERKRKL